MKAAGVFSLSLVLALFLSGCVSTGSKSRQSQGMRVALVIEPGVYSIERVICCNERGEWSKIEGHVDWLFDHVEDLLATRFMKVERYYQVAPTSGYDFLVKMDASGDFIGNPDAATSLGLQWHAKVMLVFEEIDGKRLGELKSEASYENSLPKDLPVPIPKLVETDGGNAVRTLGHRSDRSRDRSGVVPAIEDSDGEREEVGVFLPGPEPHVDVAVEEPVLLEDAAA